MCQNTCQTVRYKLIRASDALPEFVPDFVSSTSSFYGGDHSKQSNWLVITANWVFGVKSCQACVLDDQRCRLHTKSQLQRLHEIQQARPRIQRPSSCVQSQSPPQVVDFVDAVDPQSTLPHPTHPTHPPPIYQTIFNHSNPHVSSPASQAFNSCASAPCVVSPSLTVRSGSTPALDGGQAMIYTEPSCYPKQSPVSAVNQGTVQSPQSQSHMGPLGPHASSALQGWQFQGCQYAQHLRLSTPSNSTADRAASSGSMDPPKRESYRADHYRQLKEDLDLAKRLKMELPDILVERIKRLHVQSSILEQLRLTETAEQAEPDEACLHLEVGCLCSKCSKRSKCSSSFRTGGAQAVGRAAPGHFSREGWAGGHSKNARRGAARTLQSSESSWKRGKGKERKRGKGARTRTSFTNSARKASERATIQTWCCPAGRTGAFVPGCSARGILASRTQTTGPGGKGGGEEKYGVEAAGRRNAGNGFGDVRRYIALVLWPSCSEFHPTAKGCCWDKSWVSSWHSPKGSIRCKNHLHTNQLQLLQLCLLRLCLLLRPWLWTQKLSQGKLWGRKLPRELPRAQLGPCLACRQVRCHWSQSPAKHFQHPGFHHQAGGIPQIVQASSWLGKAHCGSVLTDNVGCLEALHL